ERCRLLVKEKWRPAALSVAWSEAARGLVAASVWHRPIRWEEEDNDSLPTSQGRAAPTLLRLGRADLVWPLLRKQTSPALRCRVIQSLGDIRVDPQVLARRLEEESDPWVRRGLLFGLDRRTEDGWAGVREDLAARLLRMYRTDPDPGIHEMVKSV